MACLSYLRVSFNSLRHSQAAEMARELHTCAAYGMQLSSANTRFRYRKLRPILSGPVMPSEIVHRTIHNPSLYTYTSIHNAWTVLSETSGPLCLN